MLKKFMVAVLAVSVLAACGTLNPSGPGNKEPVEDKIKEDYEQNTPMDGENQNDNNLNDGNLNDDNLNDGNQNDDNPNRDQMDDRVNPEDETNNLGPDNENNPDRNTVR